MSDFAYSKDEVSKLAKYSFEPYWPEKAGLKICITGAGGFIASHLAKRLIGCDGAVTERIQSQYCGCWRRS